MKTWQSHALKRTFYLHKLRETREPDISRLCSKGRPFHREETALLGALPLFTITPKDLAPCVHQASNLARLESPDRLRALEEECRATSSITSETNSHYPPGSAAELGLLESGVYNASHTPILAHQKQYRQDSRLNDSELDYNR